MKVKKAKIQGTYQSNEVVKHFTGIITLEERSDCIYFTWIAEDTDGNFLGSVSQPITYKIIPEGVDRFEYALNYTLNNVNTYRINRVKRFKVGSAVWQT